MFSRTPPPPVSCSLSETGSIPPPNCQGPSCPSHTLQPPPPLPSAADTQILPGPRGSTRDFQPGHFLILAVSFLSQREFLNTEPASSTQVAAVCTPSQTPTPLGNLRATPTLLPQSTQVSMGDTRCSPHPSLISASLSFLQVVTPSPPPPTPHPRARRTWSSRSDCAVLVGDSA